MKTVKRGSEVKRVSDAEAAKAVKAGWAYCPKADWKVLRIRSANAQGHFRDRSAAEGT